MSNLLLDLLLCHRLAIGSIVVDDDDLWGLLGLGSGRDGLGVGASLSEIIGMVDAKVEVDHVVELPVNIPLVQNLILLLQSLGHALDKFVLRAFPFTGSKARPTGTDDTSGKWDKPDPSRV